jgi:hypothetical protein
MLGYNSDTVKNDMGREYSTHCKDNKYQTVVGKPEGSSPALHCGNSNMNGNTV